VHRMLRIYIILIVLLHAGICSAQRDSSLTSEFARLNAKERSRIAAKEQAEAAGDAEYLRLMEQGEELFQAQRYDDALEQFKLARTRRPYNVHPKVKIQDLEALIKKRNEEKAAVAPPAERPQIISTEPALVSNTVMVIPPPPLESTPVRETLPVKAPVRPAAAPPSAPRPVPPSPPAATRVLVPGERIYKEGRSVVIERTIDDTVRPVVYRKVIQPWGDVHYFNDGTPMTVDGWSLIFGDQ
jgi:hypothetical protein